MTFKGALTGTASLIALMSAFTSAQAQQTGSTAQQGIEQVTVTGIVASRERALEIKRNATEVVDSVTAEDIGKLPDKNVADALQRVPGVETFSSSSGEGGFDENNRVAVRGTSPSLTQTTVDGHTVATGDWFILDQYQTVGRSVAFDLFPSEIVDTVNVYKTQEADLTEGGVAGTVDIVTHKPLDASFPNMLTLEASAQAVYSDLPGKTTPQFNGLLAWHNDSDTFGVIAQGFYEERDLERQGQEFLGYNRVSAAAEPALVMADPALNGVLYPTLIGQALFMQQRKREGGDVTAEWRPDNQFDIVVSSFYSRLNASDTNNNFMVWDQNEIADQNLPTSQTIKNGTLVQAVFPKVNDNCGVGFSGCGSVVDGVVEDSIDRPGEGASTWYVNGDIKWNPSANWNNHFQIGYTKGEGFTPSQPTWESEGATGTSFDFANGGPAATAFPDINTANAADMNNDWAWSDQFTATDTEFFTQADFQYELNDGALQSVKFGARYSDHVRNVFGYDEGTCFFACPGTPSSAVWSGELYPSNFGSALGGGPGFLQNIWAPNWSLVQSEVMPHVTPYSPLAFYWPGSFRTEEKDWAAYAMANFGGENWHGNAGLRFVHTGEDILSYVSDASGTPNNYGNFSGVTTNYTYTDPLPSATLVYNLNDDMQLRGAIARTIARPDYSALGGAVSLTDSILTGSGGNPNLKPVRALTYDASWDWYYGPASLVSVDLFYMDLSTDVTYGVSNATYLNATLTGQQMHPIYSTYAITAPLNGSGTDKGLELDWEQPLWWGFGVQANYTYSDGEQSGGGPLFGDAKNLYNVVGYWEKYGASVRLAYTWRSAVLVGLDRSTAENQSAIGNLAASASYDITDNIALTFDALNLNNAILKYYANNTSQPRAFYDNGRQFYFGIRIKY